MTNRGGEKFEGILTKEFAVSLDYSNEIELHFNSELENTVIQLIEYLRGYALRREKIPLPEQELEPPAERLLQTMLEQGEIPLNLYIAILPAIQHYNNPYKVTIIE